MCLVWQQSNIALPKPGDFQRKSDEYRTSALFDLDRLLSSSFDRFQTAVEIFFISRLFHIISRRLVRTNVWVSCVSTCNFPKHNKPKEPFFKIFVFFAVNDSSALLHYEEKLFKEGPLLLLHVPCLEQTLAIMALQSHLLSVCLRRSHLLLVFENHEFRIPTNVILCRPLQRFPSIFPVRARCSKPLLRYMCPRNSSCLFLIVLISDLSVLISLRIDSCDIFSVHDILIILLISHISAASSSFSISLLIVHHSHLYRRIYHTYVFKTLIFIVISIFLLVSIVFIFEKCP